MRIRLLIVAVLIAVAVFFVTFEISRGVVEAKAFRKNPTRKRGLSLLTGDAPHKVLARVLMFRPGIKEYTDLLRAYAYDQKTGLTDTMWNRWILEKDIKDMDDKERVDWLPNYPLTYSSRLMGWIEAALDRNQMEIVPLLKHAPNGQGDILYRDWVMNRIVTSNDVSAFMKSVRYIIQWKVVPPSTIFDTFWPKLDSKQQDQALSEIVSYASADNPATEDVFLWFQKKLSSANLPVSETVGELLITFMKFPTQRERAIELFSNHAVRFPPEEIAGMLDVLADSSSSLELQCDEYCSEEKQEENAKLRSLCKCETYNGDDTSLPDPVGPAVSVAVEIFKRAETVQPEVAIGALQYLLQSESDTGKKEARRLSQPILAGPDSELRKGVIVSLAREGSLLGRVSLDEAFRGKAPRRTMFGGPDEYYGSKAMIAYERLAGHGYTETGKTWPPSVLPEKARSNNPAAWRHFIEEYPWFPGTDDAYYQLAFSQFSKRDYRNSVETVFEYFDRDLSDRDADPYVLYLLKQLSLNYYGLDKEYPLLPHLRALATNPPGRLIFKKQLEIDSQIESIDWFLKNEQLIRFLGATKDLLIELRNLFLVIRSTPLEGRIRTAARVLDNKRESLPQLLYCDFLRVARNDRVFDPAISAMAWASTRASEALSRAASSKIYGAEFRDMVQWTMLHRASKDELIKTQFASAINTLAGIDARKIPSELQAQYLDELEARDEDER